MDRKRRRLMNDKRKLAHKETCAEFYKTDINFCLSEPNNVNDWELKFLDNIHQKLLRVSKKEVVILKEIVDKVKKHKISFHQ